MTVRFPDEPGFGGRFAPMRLEGEIRGLEVTQGAVPDTPMGTYPGRYHCLQPRSQGSCQWETGNFPY